MVNCPYCGEEQSENNTYCNFCGKLILIDLETEKKPQLAPFFSYIYLIFQAIFIYLIFSILFTIGTLQKDHFWVIVSNLVNGILLFLVLVVYTKLRNVTEVESFFPYLKEFIISLGLILASLELLIGIEDLILSGQITLEFITFPIEALLSFIFASYGLLLVYAQK